MLRDYVLSLTLLVVVLGLYSALVLTSSPSKKTMEPRAPSSVKAATSQDAVTALSTDSSANP
jgi:hypothetical protein